MAARRAAEYARSLQARVALVEPDPEAVIRDSNRHVNEQTLRQIAQAMRPRSLVAPADELSLCNSPDHLPGCLLNQTPSQTLQTTWAWAQGVAQVQAEQRSLSDLAAQGIDTLIGEAEFRRRPTVGLIVNGRVLRSRTYLLACGSRLQYPTITGLTPSPHHSLETQLPLLADRCPQHLVIVGDRPVALTLAQVFARLGSQVTWVTAQPSLLPNWDADVTRLLQAQLEADGIQLLIGQPVTQVKLIEQQTWIQVGNQAIAADDLVLTGDEHVELDPLNLAAVNVRYSSAGIATNHRLQTTNPHIYACGLDLGAPSPVDVTQHELTLAVKNALFWPTRQIQRAFIPQAIATAPELAQIGLTEAAARAHYGDALVVLRQPLRPLLYTQLPNQTVGFCKLILRRNGQLVGAHMIGLQAGDLLPIVAIALHHQLTLQAIAQIPHLTSHAAAILDAFAIQWAQHPARKGLGFHRLEQFFTLRRDWST